MANHVDSYLFFHTISDEGLNKLRETLERFDKYKNGYECHLAHAFYDDIDEAYANEDMPMYELVGAKWAYAQDWDDSGIAMYSAWSNCTPFVQWLINEISMVDKSVIGVYNYTDEMPNFAGVQIYSHAGLEEAFELDIDEIQELMMEEEELAKLWDSEEEEWSDDGDYFNETIWDWINNWQNKETNLAIEWIMEA